MPATDRTRAEPHDVIVVGGGLNGPVLALALARAGLRVAIVDALPAEARAADGFDGRAYALAHGSVQVLRALGLWDALEAEAQPILDIRVADGRPGEGAAPWFVHFSHGEIEEGPMGHMVEDRHLRRALDAALGATAGITRIDGRRVTAQEQGEALARVTLDDGGTLAGRVLVGADGRRSGTARRAGIRRVGRDYGQTAIVCAVRHARPHEGCAWQLFLPSGPFAILPLRPGTRSSIVWAEERSLAEALLAAPDEVFHAELRRRFGSFLGPIELEGARWSYPLALSIAERFVAPRLALVGDAAHGIHPLAGQGLNLGLRDVAALAEVLVDAHRRGEDIGAPDVLERYQLWRRFDSVAMAVGTDLVDRVFSNDNPLLRAARDAALGLANRIGPLRRAMIREAAGLTGELPRLMRGRPI